MIEALVGDPFWVPMESIRKLTDWQIWHVYLEPRIRKQREESSRRSSRRRRHAAPDIAWGQNGDDDEESPAPKPPPEGEEAEVIDEKGREMSGEAVLDWMVTHNFMRREDRDRVVAEKQALLAQKEVEESHSAASSTATAQPRQQRPERVRSVRPGGASIARRTAGGEAHRH